MEHKSRSVHWNKVNMKSIQFKQGARRWTYHAKKDRGPRGVREQGFCYLKWRCSSPRVSKCGVAGGRGLLARGREGKGGDGREREGWEKTEVERRGRGSEGRKREGRRVFGEDEWGREKGRGKGREGDAKEGMGTKREGKEEMGIGGRKTEEKRKGVEGVE